jgi:hypothetical protein
MTGIKTDLRHQHKQALLIARRNTENSRSLAGKSQQEERNETEADKRVVTPRRIMTSQPAAMVTAAIAQLAPTTN